MLIEIAGTGSVVAEHRKKHPLLSGSQRWELPLKVSPSRVCAAVTLSVFLEKCVRVLTVVSNGFMSM